jgi:hypothetical protein
VEGGDLSALFGKLETSKFLMREGQSVVVVSCLILAESGRPTYADAAKGSGPSPARAAPTLGLRVVWATAPAGSPRAAEVQLRELLMAADDAHLVTWCYVQKLCTR